MQSNNADPSINPLDNNWQSTIKTPTPIYAIDTVEFREGCNFYETAKLDDHKYTLNTKIKLLLAFVLYTQMLHVGNIYLHLA